MSNENENNIKAKKQSFLSKLKTIKGSEWIIAGVLCCVALLIYVSSSNVFNFTGSITNSTSSITTSKSSATYANNLETRLGEILSSIKGAGQVEVMITTSDVLASSNNQDTPVSSSSNVLGVVVVAEGASDTNVKLNIIRAVETLLNVNANDIEIFVGN